SVAHVRVSIHGRDQEEIDQPSDSEQSGCEEPDRARLLASIIESMRSHESENPEQVADGFRVRVVNGMIRHSGDPSLNNSKDTAIPRVSVFVARSAGPPSRAMLPVAPW